MVLHVMHLRSGTREWWIGCDEKGERIMRGLVAGTKQGVVKAWCEQHGEPEKVVTMTGLHSPAEAAATLASFSMDAGSGA